MENKELQPQTEEKEKTNDTNEVIVDLSKEKEKIFKESEKAVTPQDEADLLEKEIKSAYDEKIKEFQSPGGNAFKEIAEIKTNKERKFKVEFLKEKGLCPVDIKPECFDKYMINVIDVNDKELFAKIIKLAKLNEQLNRYYDIEKDRILNVVYGDFEYKISFIEDDPEIIKKMKMLKGLMDIKSKKEEMNFYKKLFEKAVENEFEKVINS